MTMRTISFRTQTDKVKQLDHLAATQQRDRTFVINQALDQYVALQKYHLEQIEEGLADVDAGRVVPHAEVLAGIQRRRQAK